MRVREHIPQIFNYPARRDPCTVVSEPSENNVPGQNREWGREWCSEGSDGPRHQRDLEQSKLCDPAVMCDCG